MHDNLAKSKPFVVRILDTQHSTWQGTITWVDRKETLEFRSTLELIKLIGSALEENAAEEQN